ncbi:aminotransferase class V-fold PLP-dependent enzyme [Caldichromatium japonicum]|uniref:Aminotransferase class V-fold PLP-dependent enzyme n=1 Tax=Caldichromatium japonicum TaxID=2699430 RepID=A0A6G7VBS4_9GAMM|nr:aminotransferase class V-fold PLP-dependent enzyme [Caldichromatium japonicum]QIK37402.1 aminotransferase class V-fold PLP-dependent enzyme [Caldichromatium japonicum]
MDSEFLLDPALCHLNHAAVGPWPRRTVEAVKRFAEENARSGSLRYADWLAVEQRLRERLASLIGAAATDIALIKNTSEGLSLIAQGLDWQPGDSIVGIAQEFPSNRIVWQALAERGVSWRALDLARSSDPEADLIALCDGSTRLIAVSWVQYASGVRLNLARLATWCRAHGVLLCVDAIQGLGALPFALPRYPADFVVADGHKWLLGPEGLGLLYVCPELRPRLRLTQFGWHMVEDAGDFDRTDWQPTADARRFECGSPNLLGAHALEASLSLLTEVGMDEVWRRLQKRTEHLITLLERRGFELLTPKDPERRAGIISFRVPGRSSAELYQGLMRQGVLCAQRGGGLRFSPHFYTPIERIERAVRILDGLLGG